MYVVTCLTGLLLVVLTPGPYDSEPPRKLITGWVEKVQVQRPGKPLLLVTVKGCCCTVLPAASVSYRYNNKTINQAEFLRLYTDYRTTFRAKVTLFLNTAGKVEKIRILETQRKLQR
jgi:hypothetical protein